MLALPLTFSSAVRSECSRAGWPHHDRHVHLGSRTAHFDRRRAAFRPTPFNITTGARRRVDERARRRPGAARDRG